jgi:CRP-like cAMP-binding protein
MTPAMKVKDTWLQGFLCLFMVALGAVGPAGAQALHVDELRNGTVLVVVVEPLSDATTVAWPTTDSEGNPSTVTVTSGGLTLFADLEAALSGDLETVAPAVVVAVGGTPGPSLQSVVERLVDGRTAEEKPFPTRETILEGRLERRLGIPGSDAEIRLEVNLPSPGDPSRSTIEVLWDLLPAVLAGDLAGVRSRVAGNRGVLEARTDAEIAEISVDQLRLGLARIAENPNLEADLVDASARRLIVRRRALLEQHPESAKQLLDLWIEDSADAVREFLFGGDGVTTDGVRSAARQWLPQHPGSTVLVLPPRTFNPRFAAPPEMVQLENGLSAAILERPGASLAAVCLRPVVVPDLDGELAATVLARLARELRSGESQPGWVKVSPWPPQLELAASPERLGELSETLHAAVDRLAEDRRPVMEEGGSARRKALRMMGGLLGVAEGAALTPAELLNTGNIALGIVAEDGEAAREALRKFWVGGVSSAPAPSGQVVAPVPRTREGAAGTRSVLVADLEVGYGAGEAVRLVVAEVLAQRARRIFPESSTEVIGPFVPGRNPLLLLVSADAPLNTIEEGVRAAWANMIAPASEGELEGIRRRVAAFSAATWSGSSGRARRSAAVAAGAVNWRASSDMEMDILSVSVDEVNATLGTISVWENIPTTGAGVLPITQFDEN